MKTIAFFNSKGGTGKTFHTCMFASWLAYGLGKRVCIVDADNREFPVRGYRDKELKFLENPDSPLSRYISSHPCGKPYDIVELLDHVDSFDKDFAKQYRDIAYKFILDNEDKYDYVLFNFPALFNISSPAFVCIMSRLVDLVVIPMQVDVSSRAQAYNVALNLPRMRVKGFVFWNIISPAHLKRKEFMAGGETIFTNAGVEIHPVRIKSFLKAQGTSNEKLFVNTTMCWPQRYVEMYCPEMLPFYEDVKKRLDSV